jgi:hypothetical protein
MLTIKRLRNDSAIEYAAQELKKYLRMMMPEGGEIDVTYDPDAKDGFRLGLLEDFGLPNEAQDVVLDDIIHIDTTPEGGILAGSNPRSVLFATYRLLRENGCRWLYPGPDGDYVPTVESLQAVQYHKAADHRMRGFCDEGSVSQSNMLECIDYYTKLEMNTFAIEWFIPMGYYNRWYAHPYNEANIPSEEADEEQVIQWRREVEVEVNRRGLILPAIGHGWTCKAFGFNPNNNTKNTYNLAEYDDFDKSMLAMLNGKRDFFRGAPIFTQVCLSRQDVRDKITDEIVAYAEKHTNMTYLRISLSDGGKNHCECPECSKMRPADWFWTLLNEADAKLTARNLPTRLTFSSYMDTFFAPETVRINNPKRFIMTYAPISRDYQSSITEDSVIPEPIPYVRNKWREPATTEEGFALFREYQKIWKGTICNFEYHFWRHQFLDPGGLALARRLHEDVRALKVMGLHGCMEDGSQRSAFPNGFPVYIYAETLMNRDCDFEQVAEDYFSHIYGKDWKDVYRLLKEISDTFDFAYMEGVKSKDKRISTYYDPERVSQLEKLYELAARELALAKKHMNMPKRPQTVSWRLLIRHAEMVERFAGVMIAKAKGQNYKAIELAKEYEREFGKYEWEIQRYYDHCLCCRVLEHITRRPQGIIID